jgi:hypothetical protein
LQEASKHSDRRVFGYGLNGAKSFAFVVDTAAKVSRRRDSMKKEIDFPMLYAKRWKAKRFFFAMK